MQAVYIMKSKVEYNPQEPKVFRSLMSTVPVAEFSYHCCCVYLNKLNLITLQFRLVHLIIDKNLKTQSLPQHITSKNTSNVFT
jgi:hypothetical protein